MCQLTNPNCWIGDIQLVAGLHLVTRRRGYTHHGIYVGEGRVIHYAGLSSSLRSGPVCESSVEEFAKGNAIWVEHPHDALYSGEEAVRRAYLRVGENRYRLFTNNCEHFCTWCLYGESRSNQIERFAAPRIWLLVGLRAIIQLTRKSMPSSRNSFCYPI